MNVDQMCATKKQEENSTSPHKLPSIYNIYKIKCINLRKPFWFCCFVFSLVTHLLLFSILCMFITTHYILSILSEHLMLLMLFSLNFISNGWRNRERERE